MSEKIKEFFKELKSESGALLITIIGFLLLVFDSRIPCGFLNGLFPAYQESYEMSVQYQLYTLNYMYGMSANIYEYTIGELAYGIRVDIFSDLIGYLLIIFGTMKMGKMNKIFKLTAGTSMFAIVLYVVTRLMPMVFNGQILTSITFWMIIAQCGVEICVGYLFVYGICDMLPGYQHVRDRKAIGISWFVTVILNIVVVFIHWLSPSPYMSQLVVNIYDILLLGITFLYFYFVLRNRDYIYGYKKV